MKQQSCAYGGNIVANKEKIVLEELNALADSLYFNLTIHEGGGNPMVFFKDAQEDYDRIVYMLDALGEIIKMYEVPREVA